ncbi:MAG: DMT family transporter [Saprospiraceae bacterium]|nr:DMT family transporter [Saprospiraceae bacterium]
MKVLLLLLAVIAGAVLPIQAALNVKMGKAVGDPIYAALISFVIGSVGLLIYTLAMGVDFSGISQASSVNWSVWTAGLLGAFYVGAVIILVPKLGAALAFGVIVAGQLGLSLIMDHFGLLGIPIHSVNWQRISGILLIIGGVLLIRNF